MEEQDAMRRNRRKLKSLIDANDYTAHRIDECGFEIPFTGKLRGWNIRAHLYNGWLSLSAFLMMLPSEGSARNALLERLLEVNDIISVAKFSKRQDVLTLDLEYREEHIDAEVFRNMVGLVYSRCEEYYAELFRIASGDASLVALQAAFERPSLPSGQES
ncbi:MAG: YbjN domain-containing protein [Vulcanimicrobiaceae bacterium]